MCLGRDPVGCRWLSPCAHEKLATPEAHASGRRCPIAPDPCSATPHAPAHPGDGVVDGAYRRQAAAAIDISACLRYARLRHPVKPGQRPPSLGSDQRLGRPGRQPLRHPSTAPQRHPSDIQATSKQQRSDITATSQRHRTTSQRHRGAAAGRRAGRRQRRLSTGGAPARRGARSAGRLAPSLWTGRRSASRAGVAELYTPCGQQLEPCTAR